jgi:hypothetical protein
MKVHYLNGSFFLKRSDKMNWIKIFIGILFSLFVSSVWSSGQESVLREIQMTFEHEVGGVTTDSYYVEKLMYRTENLIRQNRRFDSSQFFLLVDRNHSAQKAFIAFYDTMKEKVIIIGGEKISTGNPHRRGYFETPIGIFENKPSNMSYRALGTKNKFGWRGFGTKGSRVWDLGWQRTTKKHNEPMDIRLLIHATDPDFGEQRLGTIQSKGCIRITSRFNRFLDYYGILDREYEKNAKAKYVLLVKRKPVPFAGKFVVVIDSEEFRGPAM